MDWLDLNGLPILLLHEHGGRETFHGARKRHYTDNTIQSYQFAATYSQLFLCS